MIRKNYGWVILLIVFLEMLVYGGYVNSIGVFTVPVTEELNVLRGNYSLAMSVRNVVKFFSILCSGFVFQHFGYRRPAMLSLVISAVALVIMASAKSLGMIAIANFLLGTVYGICVTAGAVRIIRSWFHKHQGFMLGLVTMSTGLGGSLMSGILTDIIVEHSWRIAYAFTAVLLLVLAATYLLICDEPSQMGLLPYGEGETIGKT
jgi:MFS family permease